MTLCSLRRSFFPPSVMSDSKEGVPRSSDDPPRVVIINLGILIPGIVLSAIVLMAFAYTALQRRSRPHLRRVSFRLLVYALISNFILGLTLIPMETLMTGPISPAGCTFAAFASNASLLFSACMYSCMAINLQLVLIHGVNGLMMEKYYVLGSSLLVGVCNITPLAVGGQLGFYDNLCWFSNPNPVERFRWMVGTQSFWLFLMASLELVCFVILMSYMLRRRMVMKRIHSDISVEMNASQNAAYSTAPIVQFRAIILRITLYPLLSCILGFSGTTLDLYLGKQVGDSELNDKLTVLDHCIFNARPFLYAMLAATDPSFLRAVGALREQNTGTARSQFRGSRSNVPSLHAWTLADGTKTEGEISESMVRRSLDAVGRPQQTEADHTTCSRHQKGIEWHSDVVESRRESIECQI
ncbi:hypothetical protein MSAN_00250200 [Mycena sanguinolenta]|uniref:Uncharacterized protein n=1 Tax=Mycena sanguinolenta TaxID=230812 RepID=A0A8H7DL87_9AGAR|nr:hypothetical protein MSAN_00250200 [Mycena sanguinolenta]